VLESTLRLQRDLVEGGSSDQRTNASEEGDSGAKGANRLVILR
jgi:hypothetical protein